MYCSVDLRAKKIGFSLKPTRYQRVAFLGEIKLSRSLRKMPTKFGLMRPAN